MTEKLGTAGPKGKRCAARNGGAVRAAELARDAQAALVGAHEECSDRAIAKRWGYGSHHVVSPLFDPASGVPLQLGDLYALPRELGVEIARRVLADLEASAPAAQCPRQTVGDLGLAVNRATTRLLSDLGDNGLIDDHGAHAENFRSVERIARRGAEAAERRARKGNAT